ncbi:SCO family protein [Chryseobacterium sp. CT-SW4]|uniref:SCO family protein n=1 Tax=Chryseobacterium sp. SW-1 TaxID=3157343 RepID=UPI003B014CD8
MKKLIYLLLALTVISCHKKNEEISPDSIYNVKTQWEQQDGKKITFSDLKGKVLVTAMIFTSCTTACPRLTAEMKNISRQVGEVDPDDIQYILITIDPENDTPEVMKKYLSNFKLNGKEWLFLRANEEDVRSLANVMAVKYKQISPVEFSHSNIISVYSKEGKLAFQKEGLNVEINETVNAVKKQLKF